MKLNSSYKPTMMRCLKIVLLFIALLMNHEQIFAQAFSSVDIGLSVNNASLQSPLHDNRWDLSSSKSLSIRTPFYVGRIGLNLDLINYQSINDRFADVNSINISTYFGFRVKAGKLLSLNPGIQIGIQHTDTEAGTQFVSDQREIELFYSAGFEPQIQIGKFIGFGSVEYRRIYNFYRQDILFLGGGIRVRFNVPESIYSFIN